MLPAGLLCEVANELLEPHLVLFVRTVAGRLLRGRLSDGDAARVADGHRRSAPQAASPWALGRNTSTPRAMVIEQGVLARTA